MALARIEFALGEFATFEFGREALAAVAETSFEIVATSGATLNASVTAHTATAVAGAATASPQAQAAVYTRAQAVGLSATQLDASMVSDANLAAVASASVFAEGGEARLAEAAAQGVATATFEFLDGPLIDVRGHSSVMFASQAVAAVRVDTVAGSVAAFEANPLAMSEALGFGASTVDARGQGFGQSTLGAAGTAGAGLVAQRVANTTAQALGAAQLAGVGLAYVQARAASAGAAQVDATAAPLLKASTAYVISGQAALDGQVSPKQFASAVASVAARAEVAIALQAVRSHGFAMNGSASATWRRGRQVLPSMPPAEETVERPEEARAAERPEEIRIVEWA